MMQTRKQQLIAEAETHIQTAIKEGGLSPAMERIIDALQSITEALKVETDSYVQDKTGTKK